MKSRARFPATTTTITITIIGLLLGSCSGGDPGGKTATNDPKACATDAPITGAELATLPKGLELDGWGTITKVTEQAGFVGAELISDMTIVELYPEISRAVRDGGYETISGDNEGFEAELFFQKESNTGTFLLREGPCKGQVTVKLIYGAAKGTGQGAGG